MFSFGTRHDLASSECSPGPRYLVPSNITRGGRDGTPAFSLHSRPKEPRLFQVPGPGQQNPLRIKIDFVKAYENENTAGLRCMRSTHRKLTICHLCHDAEYCHLSLPVSLYNFLWCFRQILPRAFRQVDLPLCSCLFSVWEEQRMQKRPNTR